ncbi:hypothetical protein GCM10010294_53300 [Streptomyces griseoloalbus]|nr:hypothetical protein GCM10010294_53300 [Streptomyces griseoloalbus]
MAGYALVNQGTVRDRKGATGGTRMPGRHGPTLPLPRPARKRSGRGDREVSVAGVPRECRSDLAEVADPGIGLTRTTPPS